MDYGLFVKYTVKRKFNVIQLMKFEEPLKLLSLRFKINGLDRFAVIVGNPNDWFLFDNNKMFTSFGKSITCINGHVFKRFLLPPPYKSSCVNYIDGSRDRCKRRCFKYIMFEIYNDTHVVYEDMFY